MIVQFLRFGAVGIAATLLHLLVFALVLEVLGTAAWVANLIAFVFAFGLAFVGHLSWTFSKETLEEGAWRPAMVKFWVVALIGLAINSTIAYIVVDRADLSYFLAIALMGSFTPIITFLISKSWAFK